MEGGDSFNATVNLPAEDDSVPHSELPVAPSDSMDVYVPLKIKLSLIEQMMMVEKNVSECSKCIEKELDIEKGKFEIPRINKETVGNLKNGEEQTINYETEGKCMQLLMNQSFILPKFSTRDKTAVEKGLEVPKMRKFKRTGSFNSRKVALLFSVLSCFGTIILIYLTLRVKQIADASIHSE
ncbi:uncharacterized protein [Rutidosis leptorrhynchoides]|uniref:uncharacterized protein isoform X2 n=1 Tax=Rutidosis leptorrhynchoides TaxID=125765 RepID=UPI003A99E6DE